MRLLAAVVMVVLLLCVGAAFADTLCLVASPTQDELAKEVVRKCRSGDSLFMGYAQFVSASRATDHLTSHQYAPAARAAWPT